MSTRVEYEDRVRDLVRDAARWRLAGLLFRSPRDGRGEEIEALSREAADPALEAAVAKRVDVSEGAYLALLGPGGPVSPREVSCRPLEDPGKLLAEIASFHEAFSYSSSAEDPRDHVAVAADFVGFLELKEAFAVGTDRQEEADTTREARERFVARHVRVTVRGMMRRLERIGAPVDWLPVALGALRELAGPETGEDAKEKALEDAPFLRPGLEDAVFDCGGLTGDEPSACGDARNWPTPDACGRDPGD